MKKNRGANTVYTTNIERFAGKKTGPVSIIKVAEDGCLIMRHLEVGNPDYFILDRNHARLLARRILQALEDTK